jgi:hypothetical protein
VPRTTDMMDATRTPGFLQFNEILRSHGLRRRLGGAPATSIHISNDGSRGAHFDWEPSFIISLRAIFDVRAYPSDHPQLIGRTILPRYGKAVYTRRLSTSSQEKAPYETPPVFDQPVEPLTSICLHPLVTTRTSSPFAVTRLDLGGGACTAL